MIKAPIYLEFFPALSGSSLLASPSSLFLFVVNHHLAAASGEARLEVTSAISEIIVASVTLATAPEGGMEVAPSCLSRLPSVSLQGQSFLNAPDRPSLCFLLRQHIPSGECKQARPAPFS